MNWKTPQCAILALSMLAPFGAMQTASAVPPHTPDLVKGGNRWTITFYDDSDPGHAQWATQGICFYYAGAIGTHQRYYWVSDTYPDWNGRATQEGDQIFMHGDFQWPFGNRDGGHDGMEWDLTTMGPREVGMGHWKEWVEDGGLGFTIGFGNTRFERVGSCKGLTVGDAIKLGHELRSSDNVDNPMGIPRELYEKQQ